MRSNPIRWSRKIGRTVAFLTSIFLSGAALPAASSVTYEYTGSTYTNVTQPWDTAMRVTATITFASPLAANAPLQDVTASVLGFHASDGVYEAPPPSVFLHLEVATDSAQQIVAWFFTTPTACGREGQVAGCSLYSWGPQSLHRDQVILFDWHDVPAAFAETEIPGTWTLVPEPASALLAAAGLVLLGRPTRRTFPTLQCRGLRHLVG